MKQPPYNDEDKVLMQVRGITYSEVQSGAYALILAEAAGQRSIPVLIGTAEAQSIAVRVQGVKLERPMTHDVFADVVSHSNLMLYEVIIYDFHDGVFFCSMVFLTAEGRELHIESRTSDAVAMALRLEAPIFATRSVIESTGVVLREEQGANGTTVVTQIDDPTVTVSDASQLASFSLDRLRRMLDRAVAQEKYEYAAEIQRAIQAKSHPST